MSKAKKGKKLSEEHRKKFIGRVSGMKGKKHSDEAKRKLSEFHKGMKHSEETKKKMSIAHKRENLSEETLKKMRKSSNGKNNSFYGKKHTSESLKKIRKAKEGKMIGSKNPMYGKKHSLKSKKKMSEAQIGEKNHNWNNGSSFEPYDQNFNRKFKKSIKERDNHICMLCGIHREKLKTALAIHHIDYNKLNTTKENCISLCGSCHSKTIKHRIYWITFFQSLLNEEYSYKYKY